MKHFDITDLIQSFVWTIAVSLALVSQIIDGKPFKGMERAEILVSCYFGNYLSMN